MDLERKLLSVKFSRVPVNHDLEGLHADSQCEQTSDEIGDQNGQQQGVEEHKFPYLVPAN
jgi:hypothetical protein